MNRMEAIKKIFYANPGGFFIFSNGLSSREAAHFYKNDYSFYLLHAMGEALSVGIGLATAMPDLTIIVVDGDGNAMMGAASFNMNVVSNLKYYILANGVYETTGLQELPHFQYMPEWCKIILIEEGKMETPIPPRPLDIWKVTQRWLLNK